MPRDSETPIKHTTLICAFRDRDAQLQAALSTWLRWDFAQVLLIDFGNRCALHIADPRVLLLSATTPRHWHLSRALNLALPFVKTRYTLKLDADILLKTAPPPPAPHSFLTGRWQTHHVGQAHCNGSFYIETAAWKSVKGHDPLIKSYGWDDEDFYNRLQQAGLARRYFRKGALEHLSHEHPAVMAKTNRRNALATALRQDVSHAKRFLI